MEGRRFLTTAESPVKVKLYFSPVSVELTSKKYRSAVVTWAQSSWMAVLDIAFEKVI